MENKTWKIVYTKQGLKDKQKAIEHGFSQKIDKLLALVEENPFSEYPPYEKLIGDLSGAYFEESTGSIALFIRYTLRNIW